MGIPAQTDRPPQIVTAAEWGASAPRAPLARLGPIEHLVLHHSAYPSARIGRTLDAEARHVREIEAWHHERGFLAIGYHLLVAPSGRVFRGRPLDRIGAHVKGHNVGTVGICVLGDFEAERPTAAALASVVYVRERLVPGGAALPLRGHRHHRGQATACPGRHLVAWLQNDERPPAAAFRERPDGG